MDQLSIGYDSTMVTLSDPSMEIYVAHLDDYILGFIVIEMKGAFTGYIKSICVSSFNTGAQRFNGHLGYSVVGELVDYLVSGYSEILMRKTITPINEFSKE